MSSRPKLILGCNYHTTWQSKPAMRFVLKKISFEGDEAFLVTRTTGKSFWTPVSDLIFIESVHNLKKIENFKNTKKIRHEFK